MLTKKRIIILSILLGIVVIASAYIFSFPLKKTKYTNNNLTEFNKEKFISVQTIEENEDGEKVYVDKLDDKHKLVAQQGNYSLYIDETTSYIEVHDSLTNHVWASNPKNFTSPSGNELSTIGITYLEAKSAVSTVMNVNNYNLSINHGKTIDYDFDGRKTYSINYDVKNGFQILYEMRDLQISSQYIPKYVTRDVFEEVERTLLMRVDEENQESFNRYFNFKETYKVLTGNDNVFGILDGTYDNMPSEILRNLYQVFYPVDPADKIEILGEYSVERVNEENASYGYSTFGEEFFFEVALQVTLNEDGLETRIIRNSIKESPNHEIVEINLYPMFGAVNRTDISGQTTKGSLIIPDGSGAVINFNNGKGGGTNAYKGRMYGNDLANLPYTNISREKLVFPLYGLVTDKTGFAAIITDGDAMASINANVSSDRVPFNTVSTSFTTREVETVRLGSGVSSYTVTLSTREIVMTDFEVTYQFLNSTENNYVGIAKKYQKYLINEKQMEIKDKTKSPNLTLELIGAYDIEKQFLGIPYTTQDSLTTFSQAEQIINEFDFVENKTIVYKGLLNGGLKQSMLTKTKIEKVLGSKKDYKKFEKKLNDSGVSLYVNIKLATVESYSRPLDKFNYTSRRISGDNARFFDYDKATNIFKEPISTNPYILSPLYYEDVYNKFNKKNVIDKVQLEDLGSKLAGNYTKKNTVYKQDSLNIQKNILEGNDRGIMLSQPLGFAIPYSEYITDLATRTTLYSIIDHEIPLIQLVLSGLVDYTTESINLTSNRSIEFEFLKALETGSNLKYTLSYENSVELLNTKYNDYFSTYYKNWDKIIKDNYQVMLDTKIHEGHLVNHEMLRHNVYQSVYSNGVVVTINYNPYEVIIGGKTIPAIGFIQEVIK